MTGPPHPVVSQIIINHYRIGILGTGAAVTATEVYRVLQGFVSHVMQSSFEQKEFEFIIA